MGNNYRTVFIRNVANLAQLCTQLDPDNWCKAKKTFDLASNFLQSHSTWIPKAGSKRRKTYFGSLGPFK